MEIGASFQRKPLKEKTTWVWGQTRHTLAP
jgi:hypothetical protein